MKLETFWDQSSYPPGLTLKIPRPNQRVYLYVLYCSQKKQLLFVRFVLFSEQTVVISLNSNNWLAFNNEDGEFTLRFGLNP
jgi:hypothetical protein